MERKIPKEHEEPFLDFYQKACTLPELGLVLDDKRIQIGSAKLGCGSSSKVATVATSS
jgi:hypothetical protein